MSSTRTAFDRELNELHQELLYMGGIVEQQISEGIASLVKKDRSLAAKVIKKDAEVNELQYLIEDKSISLIARQQPLAKDLRMIFAAIKLTTDLERISDLAVNIAQITLSLLDEPYVKPLVDIPLMGEIAKQMTKQALDAYVQGDEKLATVLFQMEEEMDRLRDQVFQELLVIMMKEPKTIVQAIYLLLVTRHLERIGDHTTNIGEMVIYEATGKRVKLNN